MIAEIEQHKTEIEDLCRRYAVARLELFGSASIGRYRPDSDLDFLVEFGPHSSMRYADQYFGLLESLEQLFDRRVDFVTASSVNNPYLQQSIERTKESLFLGR